MMARKTSIKTPQFSQNEAKERERLVSKLGWDAWEKAKRIDVSNWTLDALSARYHELSDLIPPEGAVKGRLNGPRIDDGIIAWLRQHGAETTAIREEIYRRRRSW